MKVKDLMAELQQIDSSLDIYCYEDGPTPIQGKSPGPFDIVGASVVLVEMKRVAGKPTMEFGTDAATKKVVIIGITPDF